MLNIPSKVNGDTVNADEINSMSQELVNAVSLSGQTLSGSNLEQIGVAMAINGGAVTSFIDSGSANTIEITPVTGSTGLKIPTSYTLMNGFRVIFFAAASNTGNTTLNIGQTSGTLLGSKKLLQSNGSELNSGSITTGRQVEAIYDPNADSSAGAWIIDESIGNKVPTGSVIAIAADIVPIGFLYCNGASLLRTTYSDLFNIIGGIYGVVDGTHFNLPNYQGYFLRSWADGSSNDPDSASRTNRGDGTTGDFVGTKQQSTFQLHGHPWYQGYGTTAATGGPFATSNASPISYPAFGGTPSTSAGETIGGSGGSSETRPLNVYVKYLIKY